MNAIPEASPSDLPRISIITANWNGAARIGRYLDDLAEIDYPRSHLELIVHDNASSDDSCDIIRERFSVMARQGWSRLELLASPFHPGLNQAYVNAHAATSRESEFILEMDNDIRLAPTTLRLLIDTMRADQKAAIVGCNVRYATPPHEQNCGAITLGWGLRRNERYDPSSVTACDAILDCVMLVRRSAVESLGRYFSPDYYFFCLGTDMFQRLQKKGWKVLYDPRALAYHDAGRTTGRHSALTDYLCVRDNAVLHLNHARLPQVATYLTFDLLAALKHLVVRQESSRLQGWFDGVRKKPFDLDWWRRQMERPRP